MIPYWVIFTDRAPGCVDAKDMGDVRELAATNGWGTIASIRILPYHRAPVLNPKPDGATMTLCTGGAECEGRTSCPKRYACSE